MPRIGRYWEGHGGIYAGIARGEDCDYHLILAEDDEKRDMTWERAMDWAVNLVHEDFCDYNLPTRAEGALIYANLKDKCNDGWMWTCEPYPADNECAWVIAMAFGRNADARLTDACRARAVRTEPCE